MPPRRIDAEIDRLYQLPLDEFTGARNALAKASGDDGTWIRGLVKPPVAAWAVNQLVWRHQDIFDALVRAAGEMRRAHAAVLAGRAGDLRADRQGARSPDRRRAQGDARHSRRRRPSRNRSDATGDRDDPACAPGEDPPGRLTRTLQPGGFEMLAGLTIGGKSGGLKSPLRQMPAAAPPREAPAAAKKKPREDQPDPRAVSRAREAVAAAMRSLREAEHTARREEFEHARATREVEKTEKAIQLARTAVDEAQRELEEAESSATTAKRARETAERRAAKAEQALESARERVEAAERDLKAATGA